MLSCATSPIVAADPIDAQLLTLDGDLSGATEPEQLDLVLRQFSGCRSYLNGAESGNELAGDFERHLRSAIDAASRDESSAHHIHAAQETLEQIVGLRGAGILASAEAQLVREVPWIMGAEYGPFTTGGDTAALVRMEYYRSDTALDVQLKHEDVISDHFQNVVVVTGPVNCARQLHLSPDGKMLAVVGRPGLLPLSRYGLSSTELTLYSLAAEPNQPIHPLARFAIPRHTESLLFTDDNQNLVLGVSKHATWGIATAPERGLIEVRSLADTQTSGKAPVMCTYYTPKDERLGSLSLTNGAREIVAVGVPSTVSSRQDVSVYRSTLLPEGGDIKVSLSDRRIAGQQTLMYDRMPMPVCSSPDGSIIATLRGSQEMMVVKQVQGQPASTQSLMLDHTPSCSAIDGNCSMLAVGDSKGRIRVFSLVEQDSVGQPRLIGKQTISGLTLGGIRFDRSSNDAEALVVADGFGSVSLVSVHT